MAGERANDFVYSGTLRTSRAYVMLGRWGAGVLGNGFLVSWGPGVLGSLGLVSLGLGVLGSWGLGFIYSPLGVIGLALVGVWCSRLSQCCNAALWPKPQADLRVQSKHAICSRKLARHGVTFADREVAHSHYLERHFHHQGEGGDRRQCRLHIGR